MSGEAVHLRELAEVIGPRPATTDAEVRAADYVQQVFEARGLEVERQEFLSPRTYSWTYVVYHFLTIASAVLAGSLLPHWSRWVGFGLALVSAVLLWRDLDTRPSLSSLMPKGPSQNVIARHVPKARRGERVTKIVVVAHYDSALASLAFSPSLVKNFAATFGLMKWCTFLTPVLVLANALPFTASLQPWLWYATLAVAAYLLVPLLIAVHRELFMQPTDGANDNASGVAAMLGVMERLVPEPEVSDAVFMTQPFRRTEEAALEADVVPDDAVLSYAPAETPPARGKAFDEDFGTDEFTWADLTNAREKGAQGRLDLSSEPEAPPSAPAPAEKRGAGDGKRRERGDVDDWLGLGDGFDARQEGRRIGSWDNFGEDDDESGWKGGSAEVESFEDPEFAASEAARIRRKVTSQTDRSFAEKEVWFVATGAEEVGTAGMQALLEEYGADIRDAAIINIDNVGSGNLHWVTREGMARRYRADRRLLAGAKRVASEGEMPVRSREYHGLSTDATPALARGYRAMSVMAFDINGRLPNWHWSSDTVENVDEGTVAAAADFVVALIRAL